MTQHSLETAGVKVAEGSTLRFYRPTPAEQLALYMRHGVNIDPAISDDILRSFELHHRIWWLDNKSCSVTAGECNCGPMALSDVLKTCREISSELATAAYDLHKNELSAAWKHFWSGDALCNGGGEIREACALCIGIGFSHVEEVGEEARNLSIEFGEAVAAHSDLFS